MLPHFLARCDRHYRRIARGGHLASLPDALMRLTATRSCKKFAEPANSRPAKFGLTMRALDLPAEFR